ncbi:MAG: universal stress protein [Betaproteobacteria bacterium]|nr:universal stress protein [Betaproteobacteria bacterium]
MNMQAPTSEPTARLRHLLLATDGSEYSAGAQRVAIALAQRAKARLTAMTMALRAEDLELVGTRGLREAQERQAEFRLDAVASASAAAGVPCERLIRYGDEPHFEIINAVEEIGADLIVMGRRGARGLARLMVGDATGKVAGEAPCSVLVVPRHAAMPQRRILFCTDGSPHAEAAAAAAWAVARCCNLPVTVVSVKASQHSEARRAEADAIVKRAVDRLAGLGVAAEGRVAEGEVADAVVGVARSLGADLLVIGSHGRTGWRRLLLGSNSQRIIGKAECAVLVGRAVTR